MPLFDYSLRIAPAATRVTANKTKMSHVPTLMAILMAIAMRWYYTAHIARWRWFLAFQKATKLLHRASTRSDITNRTRQRRFFLTFHGEKRAQVDMLAPYNNRGMTYQTNQKNITNLREYIVGVVKLAIYC
jgi:hypothetical protein